VTHRRWLYTSGGNALPEPIEVTEDWSQPDSGMSRKSEEEVYGRVTATDGTDLSTRRRHREYMRANNLTIADDFKGEWERAAKERADYLQGKGDRKAIREAVGRAHYEVTSGRRNRK
jgi:hypothetical protein